MRHLPAAMRHDCGGVLLMMTTKFASQETINKHKVKKQMQSKPTPSQPYHTQNNNTKSQANKTLENHRNKHPSPSNKLTVDMHKITIKNNHRNKHPALSNKLTAEMKYFQMRKMDQ